MLIKTPKKTLKILHTSDWHLGKKLFTKDRQDEHQLFLDWLVEKVSSEEIDFLLISGDIFDVPSPPTYAQKAYFNFLRKITHLTKCQVIIIAGNHDSGSFLNAPCELLKDRQIHVFGQISMTPKDNFISLVGNYSNEKLDISALPYFRTYELYNYAKQINELEEAKEEDRLLKGLEQYIDMLSSFSEKETPHLLLAHHVFGRFGLSGSEHFIGLSGIDSIDLKLFKNKFDYLALGHVHKTQMVSTHDPIAFYPGPPIPMRFNESNKRYIAQLELNQELIFSKVELPIFRELKSLKITNTTEIDKINIDQRSDSNSLLPTYYELICHFDSPELGLTSKIKQSFAQKNAELLRIDYQFMQNDEQQFHDFGKLKKDINNPLELLKRFYKFKYPESQGLDHSLEKEFISLLEENNQEDHL